MKRFDERKHPRDKGNGQFTKSGQSTNAERKFFPHIRIKEEHPELTDAEIDDILEGVPKEAFAFNKERENTKHHQRHITEMGFKSKKEYQEAGLRFWNIESGKICYDKRRNRYCKYNAEKGFFLSISRDGIVYTFFELDSNQLKTYEKQGEYIWLN